MSGRLRCECNGAIEHRDCSDGRNGKERESADRAVINSPITAVIHDYITVDILRHCELLS